MVKKQSRTVYYSEGAKRAYLTLRSACNAEAKAIILRRYPTEREEFDDRGQLTSPSWHYTSLPRADVMHRRLARLVRKAMQS